jgi:hypothetical protein
LYGVPPTRIDGHHHMHLCANVLWQQLLPRGVIVRRNFSFARGEHHLVNRAYRRAVDAILVRRHRLVDYLYSIQPLEGPGRLERIAALARGSSVELETHPIDLTEFRFLTSAEFERRISDVQIGTFRALAQPDLGAVATN